MKTIILYESKSGFTKGCAEELLSNLEEAEMKNIAEEANLKEYDTILMGHLFIKVRLIKK